MSKKKDKTQSQELSQKLSFEDAMNELEALVDSMEKDSLTLEESLMKFEKGVKLTRICQQALAKAEQEVKILTADGETDFTTDFSIDD
ncbi:MAG: exodeoxyribonuclease VII small subunit [Thiotrichaceae bacterium]